MAIYAGRPDLEYEGPTLQADVLISTALESALQSRGKSAPPPISVRALIDTGSTRTVIREGIAQTLGLEPVSSVRVKTASSTETQRDVYSIQLVLPNGPTADLTQAVEMPLQEQGIDVLIGRDILAGAVFVYLGTENTFTLSF